MDVLEPAFALLYYLPLEKYFVPKVVHFLLVVKDVKLLFDLELFSEEHIFGLPFDELPLGAAVLIEAFILEVYRVVISELL